jgi:DNA-binding FrmR family transcriptional regulator
MPKTLKKRPTAGGSCCCPEPDAPVRLAVEVEPELKQSNLTRLRRIEGQVRGLQKMIEQDRYCADIMIQVSSVQEGLRAVSRRLMQNHLQHCATEAIRKGTPEQAEAMCVELLELVFKHSR